VEIGIWSEEAKWGADRAVRAGARSPDASNATRGESNVAAGDGVSGDGVSGDGASGDGGERRADGGGRAGEAPASVWQRAGVDGVECLSDGQLVDLIGGPGRDVELPGDGSWSRWTGEEWRTRRARSEGVREQRRALRLAAALELGRRAERARSDLSTRLPIDGPTRALHWFAPHFRGERQECFAVLLLDGRHRVKRLVPVGRGTLTASLVHPREVFGPAVREGAAAVLVAHNHPSGDPEPSAEDLAVTRRLGRSGRLLGIPLLDHLVVAGSAFRSLRRTWSGWGRFGPEDGGPAD
jgi:DNA repair protein RadC